MTTANKTVTANINAYILSCIATEEYDLDFFDDKRKLELLADTFKKEYCFPDNFRRYGTVQNVMAEWFQGLPSSFNLAFNYSDILSVAQSFGNLPAKMTPAAENKVLANWWIFMATKVFQLMAKHGISVTYFLD